MPTSDPSHHRYITDRRKESEEEKKWWNDQPLDGNPNRPAVWLTNILSKSPRLIGWDDERMEQRALDALPNRDDDEEDITEIHIGPKREVVDQVAFGLLGIAAREVTKHLLHLEESSDGIRKEGEKEEEKKIIDSSDEPHGMQMQEEARVSLENDGSASTRAAAFAQYSGEDAATMREAELYKLALRSVRWQRDNYLVGRKYADERKVQRRRHLALPESLQPRLQDFLPMSRPFFDPSALGNQQIVSLGSWLIPGPVVQRSLLPIVVALPTGPLRLPILNATVNLIPLSQGHLDRVVKERLLWFLKDNHMRELIKTSAHGYIANTYREDSTNVKSL